MKFIYHFRVRGTGAERVHIIEVADGLRDAGHEVNFISPTNSDPARDPSSERREKNIVKKMLNLAADKVPQTIFELMEICYNAVAFWKFRSAYKRLKPDAIYERYAFFCFAGVLAARIWKLPIVMEVNEIAGFKRVRKQKMWRVARQFEKFIFKRADLIVVVSDFLKERIIEIGALERRVVVIPNAVNRKNFSMVQDTTRLKERYGVSGKNIIGFIGYLVPWHRFDILLKAFEGVKKEFPDTVLMLVGHGVLKKEIEDLAEKLGIADAVVMTGNVPHENIAEYIGLFDIALIPHSNEYRSPMKMFEYMAVGKPVIAPDVQPVRIIIDHDVTGVLFRTGDGAALEKAMIMLLGSPGKRRDIGKAGRDLVLAEYTWDKNANKTVSLLKSIMKETLN